MYQVAYATINSQLAEETRLVALGLERFGGGFEQALRSLILAADADNLARIKQTWSSLWEISHQHGLGIESESAFDDDGDDDEADDYFDDDSDDSNDDFDDEEEFDVDPVAVEA